MPGQHARHYSPLHKGRNVGWKHCHPSPRLGIYHAMLWLACSHPIKLLSQEGESFHSLNHVLKASWEDANEQCEATLQFIPVLSRTPTRAMQAPSPHIMGWVGTVTAATWWHQRKSKLFLCSQLKLDAAGLAVTSSTCLLCPEEVGEEQPCHQSKWRTAPHKASPPPAVLQFGH